MMRPPVIIGPTSCSRKVNRVTTPKLPPPPRSAQNSSGCWSRLAVRIAPSAVTASTSARLSTVKPKRRARYPQPPPRVRPATPVSDTNPSTVASPWAWVAWSTSPSRQPGPTWATLAWGSTLTSRICDRSSVKPPSAMEVPAMLWPPPLMLSSSPWSLANPTAAATSWAEAGCRTRAGSLAAGTQQPALDPRVQVLQLLRGEADVPALESGDVDGVGSHGVTSSEPVGCPRTRLIDTLQTPVTICSRLEYVTSYVKTQ